MDGRDAAGCAAEALIGCPHRLQNADSGGTRLPQREQNEPTGREVVSTGRGIEGTDSMIFLRGRVISIFFFSDDVPALPDWGRGVLPVSWG